MSAGGQSSGSRARSAPWLKLIGALAAAGALLGVVVWVVWQAPEALYPREDLPQYRAEAAQVQAFNARTQAIATTRAALVAGLAGLAALGGLWINGRTLRAALQAQEDARRHQEESLRLEREGHLTDRYSKAVEQLGAVDKLDVRLGGIYALERIAQDSERDHPTIVEVLSAFVRESTREPPAPSSSSGGEQQDDPLPRPRTDVQAALTVLGRLPRRPGMPRVDLSTAHLGRANLADAHLERALLSYVRLERANLAGTRLEQAHMFNADLRRVFLVVTHLDGADLSGANLEEAELMEATLVGAQLVGANLERTKLLFGTDLEGANLKRARLAGADLSQAKNLAQQQVNVALGDSATILPAGLQRPASWPAALSQR